MQKEDNTSIYIKAKTQVYNELDLNFINFFYFCFPTKSNCFEIKETLNIQYLHYDKHTNINKYLKSMLSL